MSLDVPDFRAGAEALGKERFAAFKAAKKSSGAAAVEEPTENNEPTAADKDVLIRKGRERIRGLDSDLSLLLSSMEASVAVDDLTQYRNAARELENVKRVGGWSELEISADSYVTKRLDSLKARLEEANASYRAKEIAARGKGRKVNNVVPPAPPPADSEPRPPDAKPELGADEVYRIFDGAKSHVKRDLDALQNYIDNRGNFGSLITPQLLRAEVAIKVDFKGLRQGYELSKVEGVISAEDLSLAQMLYGYEQKYRVAEQIVQQARDNETKPDSAEQTSDLPPADAPGETWRDPDFKISRRPPVINIPETEPPAMPKTLEEQLNDAQMNYFKAKTRLDNASGIIGSLKKMLRLPSQDLVKKEYEEAAKEYEKLRAEYMFAKAENFVAAGSREAEARFMEYRKKEGVKDAKNWFRAGWNALGEANVYNLVKKARGGKEIENRVAAFVLRTASVRMAVSVGLTGTAFDWSWAAFRAGEVAAGSTALTSFWAKRAMGTGGGAIGFSELYKRLAAGKQEKILRQKLASLEKLGENVSENELTEALASYELVSFLRGRNPAEEQKYKELLTLQQKKFAEWVEAAREGGSTTQEEMYQRLTDQLRDKDSKTSQEIRKRTTRAKWAGVTGAFVGSGALMKGISYLKGPDGVSATGFETSVEAAELGELNDSDVTTADAATSEGVAGRAAPAAEAPATPPTSPEVAGSVNAGAAATPEAPAGAQVAAEQASAAAERANRLSEMATAEKGDSVWRLVRQQYEEQIKAHPQKFGLTQEDLQDAAKIKSVAEQATAKAVLEQGHMNTGIHPGTKVILGEDGKIHIEGKTYPWEPTTPVENAPAETAADSHEIGSGQEVSVTGAEEGPASSDRAVTDTEGNIQGAAASSEAASGEGGADVSDLDASDVEPTGRHAAALAADKTSSGLRLELGKDYQSFVRDALGSPKDLDKVGSLTVDEFFKYSEAHPDFAASHKGLLDWGHNANVSGEYSGRTVHDMLINTAGDEELMDQMRAAKEAVRKAAEVAAEAKAAALESANVAKAHALVENGKLGDALHLVLADRYNTFMETKVGASARAIGKFREMTLDQFMEEYSRNEKLWKPLGKFKRLATNVLAEDPRFKDLKVKDLVLEAALDWKSKIKT